MHNITSTFTTASSASEILELIKNITAEALIFLDVDDTIIMPKSVTFRKPPYNPYSAPKYKNEIIIA